MRRSPHVALAAVCGLLLVACSSGNGTSTADGSRTAAASSSSATSSASTSSTSSAPSTTAAAAAAASTAAPDPCTVVTRAEASALAGTAFGPGKEETGQGGGRRCVYGGQTLNVFTVETAKAKDAATAQAQWASTKAEVDAAVQKALPAGVKLQAVDTDVQGLGDKAAAVATSTSIQGRRIALSGVYVLQGPTFFAFQDLVLGKSAPTTADMKAQAATSLARVS